MAKSIVGLKACAYEYDKPAGAIILDVMFNCPGCGCVHSVRVNRPANDRPVWKWDGGLDNPTFTPSVLVHPAYGHTQPGRCHSFVTNGSIRFLQDCGHELAGQTVPLPDWND